MAANYGKRGRLSSSGPGGGGACARGPPLHPFRASDLPEGPSPRRSGVFRGPPGPPPGPPAPPPGGPPAPSVSAQPLTRGDRDVGGRPPDFPLDTGLSTY